jgi:hypothetical protein
MCSSIIFVKYRVLSISLLALCSGTALSEARLNELGRLFTEPAQREKLEAVRHGAYDQQPVDASSVTAITVNGVMLRSDGESVVWVNGKSTLEGQLGQAVNVHTGAANQKTYSVPIAVQGRVLRMKPGQSWSDGSDGVKDNY